MNEGWKCPVCGRGVAPTEKVCPCLGGLPYVPYTPPYVPYPILPDYPTTIPYYGYYRVTCFADNTVPAVEGMLYSCLN
jgi:hypothetical protein